MNCRFPNICIGCHFLIWLIRQRFIAIVYEDMTPPAAMAPDVPGYKTSHQSTGYVRGDVDTNYCIVLLIMNFHLKINTEHQFPLYCINKKTSTILFTKYMKVLLYILFTSNCLACKIISLISHELVLRAKV